MEGAWLYFLRCSDGSYYVCSTRAELEFRVSQHQSGLIDGYTARRLPVTLVFSRWFDRITDAISAEQQAKGWRREKKEAVIEGRLDLLPALSSRKWKRPT